MRRQLGFLIAALFALTINCQKAAAQACTAINSPTPEYFAPIAGGPETLPDPADPTIKFGLGTEKCSLGTPGINTALCRDSDSNLEARFSNTLLVLQVPTTWATWSSPPDSESATPIVAFNSTSNLTVTLADGFLAGLAGMEIEPNFSGVFNITAVFRNLAGAPILTVTRGVDGGSGARLFAANCDEELIHRVDITADLGAGGFAIAKLRADSFVINRDIPPAVPQTAPSIPKDAKANTDVIQPE